MSTLHDVSIMGEGERFRLTCNTCGATRTFIYGPLAVLWAESHVFAGDSVQVAS